MQTQLAGKAAAMLNVPDNGEEIETEEPRTVRGFRIRGQSYTLLTEQRD